MIIDPLTDSTLYQSGGPFFVNTTNFPALKHHFNYTGISGLDNVDLIGGTLKLHTGTSWNIVGGTNFTNLGSTSISAGTFAAPGTSDFLFVWTGNSILAADNPLTIGDANNGVGVNLTGAGNFATFDINNYATLGALSGATATTGQALCVRPVAGTGTYVGCTATTNYTGTFSVTGSINKNWVFDPAKGFSILPGAGGRYNTDIWMFIFANGSPSNSVIASGCAWMAANPGKAYPVFKGLA